MRIERRRKWRNEIFRQVRYNRPNDHLFPLWPEKLMASRQTIGKERRMDSKSSSQKTRRRVTWIYSKSTHPDGHEQSNLKIQESGSAPDSIVMISAGIVILILLSPVLLCISRFLVLQLACDSLYCNSGIRYKFSDLFIAWICDLLVS